MVFEHYLLLMISILPLIYKYSFWLFTIQLKEYRWDRIKEYMKTPQGNSALINIWTVLELPLLLVSFIVFFDKPFEIIIFNVLFVFLLIQNLFVFRKVLTGKLIKPKLTGRLLLILVLLLGGISYDMYFIVKNELGQVIYSYVLTMYLFTPFIIYFIILLTLPIVNIIKRMKIKKASLKSIANQKPIKIGITGSYGKSSVKEFLASILEQKGKTLKTPENINSELGVSNLILKKLNNKFKYFVAEMGAYKIGEINLLGEIVNHKYGILTSIGNQHLGLFGSQKNIVRGKSEIANSVLKNNGTLYVNWNSNQIRDIKFDKELNIVKYGNYKGVDTKYKIIGEKNGKTEFVFKYNDIDTKFKVDLIGEHNIINLTGVLTICYDLGLETTFLKKYLKKLKVPKNTLNVVKTKKYTLIDDTYNLSEAGLFAGLQVLDSYEGLKILIVDDILELGKDSKLIHHKIGKKIAKDKLVDKVHFVGINYRSAFHNGLFDGGFNTNNLLNHYDTYEDNSVILFEGRNAKKYLDKVNKDV